MKKRKLPVSEVWPFLRVAAAALLAVLLSALPAVAQPESSTEQVPPRMAELLSILQDPSVQAWIKQHATDAVPPGQAAMPRSSSQPSPAHFFADRLTMIRQHLIALKDTAPVLPRQLGDAIANLASEFRQSGTGHALFLVVLFVALGAAFEWLLRRAFGPSLARVVGMSVTSVRQRLHIIGLRLAYGVGSIAAFAGGSAVSLLVGDWPVLLRETVVGYLVAFVILRAALVVGRFAMSPDDDRFTLLPMQRDAARFWYRRIGFFVGWFAFGWITVGVLDALQLPPPSRQLMAYVLGLGLVIIGFEAAWRRPANAAGDGDVAGGGQARRRRIVSLLISGYIILLWLFWVAGMMVLFWLTVMAWALPASMRLSRHAIRRIMRPAEADSAAADEPTVLMVLLERGMRVVLIIATVFLLAHVWQVDLAAQMANDTVIARLLRGTLTAIIIVFVADVAWRIARTLIDSRIAASPLQVPDNSEEGRRRSRIRTLLPILRNVLFMVMITIAALMVLSSMGVEIGPLIAGAGVIGVAVGFGAQTLVKDVISGVFYLLDDAFRVGEYIQSGNYKGTVESFSLRSVKLRHHRGPLYTVPFGELGAVENMSRDWVIDKTTIGVTYDSDLDKARKLIKQIGKQLAEDPEYKPNIIEPLKMQGVEQFGDFAIQLRMKMTCRPGEQFVIRRKALAMIKQAFDANGIKFASPTVRVAGGEAPAAAAQEGLRIAKLAVQGETG